VVIAEREGEVLKPLSRLKGWVLLIAAGKLILVIVVLEALIPLIASRLQPGATGWREYLRKKSSGGQS
jgi:hypothetical protein